MKNRAVTVFVLAYILLGSVYSVTPTFADNDFTIKTILDESKQGILDKFLEFETNGLETPSTADSLYAEGLVQYDEAIALLISGDFENAKDPGLEALSLFEDAYEALLEAEEELVVEQEGYIGDPLVIADSIIELQIRADEIRDLISINDLDISLVDLDAAISSANKIKLDSQENFAEALRLIESAEDILNEILERIEYKAEEDQDKRVEAFVENLLVDLEDAIFMANELGFDESVISQLQDLVNGLANYDDPSDIFESTGESSDHKDALSNMHDVLPDKVKLEAELVVDGTDDDVGEAKFEQRGDRKELEVEIEDQEPGAVFTVQIIGDPDPVGEITIKDNGDGKLKLKSKDGDIVPSVTDGDIVEVTDGTVVLVGTFSLEDDDDIPEVEVEEEKVKLEAELVIDGTDDDVGKAKFEQRSDRIKLSVEIEDQDPDTVFTVSVNGISVGDITTDEFGNGELELDDRDEGVTVDPRIAGDIVEVTDGTVLLVGTFSLEDDDDTPEVEVEEEEELEFEGILTFVDDNTFTLPGADGPITITVDSATEIDDDLPLSELDGLEVEVDAIEIDGVLIATEIELDGDDTKHEKVTLCHKDKNTITISANAVDAHLDHDDELGYCDKNKQGFDDDDVSDHKDDKVRVDDDDDDDVSDHKDDKVRVDDDDDDDVSDHKDDKVRVDDDDNSGSGSSDDDNSGSGNSDDDDSDNSGSGNSDDDDSDNSGSGNSDDDDSDNSGSGSDDDDDDDE